MTNVAAVGQDRTFAVGAEFVHSRTFPRASLLNRRCTSGNKLNMPLPFHVSCSHPSDATFFQLQDRRFQFIREAPLAPFMAGFGYLLVERSFGDYLRGLGLERVGIEPAVIWNRRTDEHLLTHDSVSIGQSFQVDQINDLNTDGPRLLVLGKEYVFASPELQHMLIYSPFNWLTFTKGLSGFVGEAESETDGALG